MQRKGVLITILARALLICIQPGFSVSLGDLTAVFPGMMEEMEDGKNEGCHVMCILHSACILSALPYAYHVFFTSDWKSLPSQATVQDYCC